MVIKRDPTKKEEVMNAITHGAGLGLAIAALVVLIVSAVAHGTVWHVVGFTIYGSTLVILYLASTLYHSFPRGKAKHIFRILDHSAIFLLIAGTYTPITLVLLKGALGWTLFGIVWGIAIAGIVFKAFFVQKYEVLSVILYLVMGWIIVIAIKPLLAAISTASLAFLISGGIFYTAGIAFYACQKLKYHHAVWHLFVLGGSTCHFFTVLYMLPL